MSARSNAMHLDARGLPLSTASPKAAAAFDHLVTFRLAHFVNFWLGRPEDMVASVERVIPAWSEGMPGYVSILACRCFAHEEAGNYLGAEPSGRRAIELDPGDLWAAHAVAHV